MVTSTTENDPYLDLINENRANIVGMYRLSADKKPVMLYEVQEPRIYAYPYQEFKADLNACSQRLLTEHYHQAVADGQVVVFVRDNLKQKLMSYSIPL